MAIEIEEVKTVTVKDNNGIILHKGDPIMIRVKNQDIVCRFIGIELGYFVTETLDAAHTNKYRQGSIGDCVRISGIRPWPEEETIKSAGKYAADPALAPAT